MQELLVRHGVVEAGPNAKLSRAVELDDAFRSCVLFLFSAVQRGELECGRQSSCGAVVVSDKETVLRRDWCEVLGSYVASLAAKRMFSGRQFGLLARQSAGLLLAACQFGETRVETGWFRGFVESLVDLTLVAGLGSDGVALVKPVAAARVRPGLAVGTIDVKKSHVERSVDTLVPASVCRELFKCVGVSVSGEPALFVVEGPDGVMRLVKKGGVSAAAGVQWDGIPKGTYELPGGFGRRVPAVFLQQLFFEVVVFVSAAARDGCCYLRSVRPWCRLQAMSTCGRNPTKRMLLPWAVEVGAAPIAKYIENKGTAHLCTVGALPTFGLEVTVGGTAETASTGVLDAILADVLSEPSGVHDKLDVEVEYGDGRDEGAGVNEVVQARGVDTLVTTSGRGVARLRPVRGAGLDVFWARSVGSDSSQAWQKALSRGMYLGTEGVKALRAGKVVPKIVTAPDVSVAMATGGYPTNVDTDVAMVVFHDAPIPVEGWSYGYAGMVSRRAMILVPPGPGQWCRYEFDVSGELEVNGVWRLPAARTVVWTRYAMTVVSTAKGWIGESCKFGVTRFVSKAGVSGVGRPVAEKVDFLGSGASVGVTPVVSPFAHTVSMVWQSEARVGTAIGGLYTGVVSLPSGWSVVAFAGLPVASGEAVCVCFRGEGLVAARLAGATVMAGIDDGVSFGEKETAVLRSGYTKLEFITDSARRLVVVSVGGEAKTAMTRLEIRMVLAATSEVHAVSTPA